MLVVLVATQVVGFVVLYVLLRRYLTRVAAAVDPVELRSEVNGLLAELNGTTERNVALLEDGIRRLSELLRRVDRHGTQPPPNDGTEAPDDLRTQVLRMRRLGFSNAAITERLSTGRSDRSVTPTSTKSGARGSPTGPGCPTSREEVELLVNLSSDRRIRGG